MCKIIGLSWRNVTSFTTYINKIYYYLDQNIASLIKTEKSINKSQVVVCIPILPVCIAAKEISSNSVELSRIHVYRSLPARLTRNWTRNCAIPVFTSHVPRFPQNVGIIDGATRFQVRASQSRKSYLGRSRIPYVRRSILLAWYASFIRDRNFDPACWRNRRRGV